MPAGDIAYNTGLVLQYSTENDVTDWHFANLGQCLTRSPQSRRRRTLIRLLSRFAINRIENCGAWAAIITRRARPGFGRLGNHLKCRTRQDRVFRSRRQLRSAASSGELRAQPVLAALFLSPRAHK